MINGDFFVRFNPSSWNDLFGVSVRNDLEEPGRDEKYTAVRLKTSVIETTVRFEQ